MDDNTTIPQWIAVGRTVLLPKAKDLSSKEEYRPITYLNTSYKLFTGILAKFTKEHAEENEIWDRNQMGTCQDVLGTVDQLLIDNCIMEEVRIHKRNWWLFIMIIVKHTIWSTMTGCLEFINGW